MTQHTVPIYQDQDMERLVDLRREVDIAERYAKSGTPSPRMGDDEADPVVAAKEAFDAFVLEAAERAEIWKLETIGHEEFRALLRAHPPRTETDDKGVETLVPEDQGFDVNTETFPKALLLFVDPEDEEIRTVVAPKFDSEAALRRRVKRLSAGQFDTLWVMALSINRNLVSDPLDGRFSPVTRSTAAI